MSANEPGPSNVPNVLQYDRPQPPDRGPAEIARALAFLALMPFLIGGILYAAAGLIYLILRLLM